MSDGHLDTFLLHETVNGVLVLGRAANLLRWSILIGCVRDRDHAWVII